MKGFVVKTRNLPVESDIIKDGCLEFITATEFYRCQYCRTLDSPVRRASDHRGKDMDEHHSMCKVLVRLFKYNLTPF